MTTKRGQNANGIGYAVGVFISNGMSGVLTKLFLEGPYPKTDAAAYSIWIAIVTLLLALVCLLFVRNGARRPSLKAVFWSGACSTVGRVANYWLVLALAVLPASVQYPFVTGGTMIVSTLLGYWIGQRPSRRELLAVAFAFLGVLALVAL